MGREIVVGTRASALALWQTKWAVEKLRKLNPEYTFKVVEIKTKGDKILDVALSKIGDKGLFTKELEVAMLDREIDLAVHSMKDLPTKLPDGLMIGAICERVEPGDVLVSRNGLAFEELPQGARVGTSSLRRRAQILSRRPDLKIEDIRGNVKTRLDKLESQKMDAIILAFAGLDRLGYGDKITQKLPYDVSLPAVGQGSVGVEIRENDEEILKIVKTIEDQEATWAILAERGLLRTLEGGCQIPIGALGTVDGDTLKLKGLVASLDGKTVLRDEISGKVEDAEKLGIQLGQRLSAQGADKILCEVRRENENNG